MAFRPASAEAVVAMRRVLTSATALLLAVAILWDPYTRALNVSDVARPAPWWQLALGLTDVSLLATIAALVWRQRKGAHHVVLGELFFALGGAIILVRRDGVARFAHGFGADEYLSLFLVTLAIRVALYASLVPRELKRADGATAEQREMSI